LSHSSGTVRTQLRTRSVPALERGLAILEVIAKSRYGLTLSEVVRQVKAPKSTVHCLLLTFERQGYLQKSGRTGRLVCGTKLVRMARSVHEGAILRERAAPLLRDLMQRTGRTVHMAVLEPDQATLIAKVTRHAMPRVATWIGKRLDLHCTALGKCLIAWQPAQAWKSMIQWQGLLRHNENTIVSVSRLERELERVRELGYAVDDEEEELGMRCVGVPVFDSKGRVTLAVSVSGTVNGMDMALWPALADSAKHTASALSRLLEPFEDAYSPEEFDTTGSPFPAPLASSVRVL